MHRFVPILILLAGMPAPAGASDPAYVDSPAGRAVTDPARADGFSSSAMRDLATTRSSTSPLMQVQLQMQLQAMALARQQQAAASLQDPMPIAAGPATAGPGQPAITPQAAAATPMQQVGAGAIEDIGNAIDANLQRQIHGSGVPVTLVPAPGATGYPPPGW